MIKLYRIGSAASIATLLLLFSCSAPSSDKEKTIDPESTFTTNDTHRITIYPDTIDCPGAGFSKFMEEAKKIGFRMYDPVETSGQKNFFALNNVSQTFSYLETGILSRTKNAVLVFENNGIPYGVEEWAFSSLSEAELVEHALTAPVEDKRKERFVRTPFTFWRINNRMYYIHVENEKKRAEMEQLNNLLVNCLTPGSTN